MKSIGPDGKPFPDTFYIVRQSMKKFNEDKEKYSTGATRNPIAPVRYDLIKWDFIRELAMVMDEGVKSHGAPGSDGNWESGLPKSSTINHMFEHWHKYLAGDRKEPHLAKMAFALMALWYYEDQGIDVKE